MTIANSNLQQGLVAEIQSAPFDFYLTGSRWFNNAHKDSDWDFFVERSDKVLKWLKEKNFQQNHTESYAGDTSIARVFTARCLVTNVLVDVQVLYEGGPFERKVLVNDTLKSSEGFYLLASLEKTQRAKIWNILMRMAEIMETP